MSLQPPNRAPKALGIHWDVKTDSFYVSTPKVPPSSATVTKRLIASATAGVYDVLGLFAPAILPARLQFQETWKRSLSWDKPVPDDLRALWHTWVDDLHSVNYRPVPRRDLPSSRVCVWRNSTASAMPPRSRMVLPSTCALSMRTDPSPPHSSRQRQEFTQSIL